MIGILALLIFSTYVCIACWSTLLFDSRRARVAVVCFWLLVPTGDALVGRLWLRFKCHQGAVLQISQTVPPVEVVFVRKHIDEYSPQTFGYHSVEGTPRQNVGRMSAECKTRPCLSAGSLLFQTMQCNLLSFRGERPSLDCLKQILNGMHGLSKPWLPLSDLILSKCLAISLGTPFMVDGLKES